MLLRTKEFVTTSSCDVFSYIMYVGNKSMKFTCFFYQNCKNNSCVIKSEGFTCERCIGDNGNNSSDTIYSVIIIVLLLDYYRSSAVCTECLVVPVSIIIAVLFILLTLYGLVRKGISISQLTQVCSSYVPYKNKYWRI